MTVAIIVLALAAATIAAVVYFCARANRRAADLPLAMRAEQPPLTRPCPRCGTAIGTHQPVCASCGAGVPTRSLLCPTCGLHVGALARFCKRCHTPLHRVNAGPQARQA